MTMAIEALEQQTCEDLINRRATTCRHGGHCEWLACDKCNHYEPDGLNQQPCEDAISRQAVLDIIMPYCQDDDGSVENTDDLRNALDDIEFLPSVTPKEKTGKWIRVTDKTGHLVWECGCGWQQRFATNFCPDCGCHMFEPQESEDEG